MDMSGKNGRGRPRRGESAWGPYIENSPNAALRKLGREAERRGYSMLAFSEILRVDLRCLQRYFESKAATLKTITSMSRALGYPSIVARALSGALAPKDVGIGRENISFDLAARGKRLFGSNRNLAMGEFDEWSRHKKNSTALEAACAASILARFGLSDDEADELGPGFTALEKAFNASGFSLRRFLQDKAQIDERQRRASRLFGELCLTLGISTSDEKTVGRILARYGIPGTVTWADSGGDV